MSNMPPEARTKKPQIINTAHYRKVVGLLFFTSIGWILFRGWQLRTEQYITAEKGLGYTLGIIGGSLMLALLLYPVRKKFRATRNWGPIRYWFRMHMLFGILGPSLILFHANFSFGSLNSNVALACMLLVAASGIVGRFLYTRIHYGLYGRRASLQELGALSRSSRSRLAWVGEANEEFISHIEKIEKMALESTSGVSQSIGRWTKYTATAWWHRWRLRRLLSDALHITARKRQWDRKTRRSHLRQARHYLNIYFEVTRKVLVFNFYERLFALWHVLHFPFFLMMVLSGILHVIAVHMY